MKSLKNMQRNYKQIPVHIADSNAFYIRKLSKAKFKTKDEKIILVQNYKANEHWFEKNLTWLMWEN